MKNVNHFLFIADLHALIKVSDPEQFNQLTHGIALAWMASGLDPQKTYFYRQSDVPEITKLPWIQSCVN
jgi:Tryptophanyl-tRNA synthetase